MEFDLKIIYDSLEKNYNQESLNIFSQEFHTHFGTFKFPDTKYGRYIPALFFDFFNAEEFKVISKNVLEETAHPNLYFGSLLFRLSIELATDKTNHEKELMFSLIFNLIGRHNKSFNDAIHYSLGFVSSQASQIGVDISSALAVMYKLDMKNAPYFEEGFIDGLSNEFAHVLKNEKLFTLFLAKYENWSVVSQDIMKKMYSDYLPVSQQVKMFNPVNCQSFFWMNQFFTNESLRQFVVDYSQQAFNAKIQSVAPNATLEKNYFNLQQEVKVIEKNTQKFKNFINILGQHFEGLKEINPLDENSPGILNQILINQKSYITELEEYKVESERSKKLKEGIKKVL